MSARNKRRPAWGLWLLALPLLLTGCITYQDPEAQQIRASEEVVVLPPGGFAGQTFTSRRAGLNGIDLWLELTPEAQQQGGEALIRLTRSPVSSIFLYEGHFGYAQIAAGAPLRIALPPQPDPPGEAYFLSLTTVQGGLRLLGSQSDVYPHGSAIIDGEAIEGDLAFQLSYQYTPLSLWNDLLAALSQSYLALPLALTLFLPGALLLSWLRAPRDFSLFIALASGLSLAALPVLLAWTSVSRFRWSPLIVFAAAALLALALIVQTVRWLHVKIENSRLDARRSLRLSSPKSWDALALSMLFIAALVTRLVMTRDLAGPPWVDSVHHALITRLILEQGRLPVSYAPFLEIATASYHAGFHSLLAFFTWLSGLDLSQAMLLFGQALNALSVYSVYLFTRVTFKDRWAALLAAGVAAFFTPMPAYYTSWGRYTQLTGLLILPSALYWLNRLSDALLRTNSEARKTILLAGLAGAGLFLSHYRVAALLGAYLIADWTARAAWSAAAWLKRDALSRLASAAGEFIPLRRRVAYFALAVAAGLIFALPWLPPALTSLFLPKLSGWSGVKTAPFADFAWMFLTTAWGTPAMILAALGLALAVLRRQRFALTFPLWIALLFLMANLGALGLPGAGFLNNTSVEISLFLPIAALSGYFVSQALQFLSGFIPHAYRRAYYAAWVAVIAITLFAASRQIVTILNPVTFLYRQDDHPALTWIAANIPADETVVINPFAWGYGLYAGNDGGYWISPLARRQTLPPPVLYGFGDDAAQMQTINALSQQIIDLAASPEDLFSLMLEQNLRYIYIGRRGGALSPTVLAQSAFFETVYHQDGVWIFKTQENPQP